MTLEELQEIETLHREYVRGNKPIPDWLGPKSTVIRAIGLAHCLAADYRAAVALTEHIQADLEAMHRANARAEATIADLREDLARARLINTQAEKTRDENERLRRDLAAIRLELQTLHGVLSGARSVAVVEGKAAK
jgi:hypothetical protein